MNEMFAMVLRRRFVQIPFSRPIIYDWHSVEGEHFLDLVDGMVEDGIDLDEIGKAICISDFSKRYKIIRRGK